jgi:hypothetical protein
MSHGPFGLRDGKALPVPVCCAIANVAPASVSARAKMSPELILVFMVNLSALPGFTGHLEFSWLQGL